MNAGYRAYGEQTAKLVERWSGAPVDALLGSESVKYLTRSDQLADLAFILEHIDDLNTIFALKNDELISGLACTRPFAGFDQPAEPAS